MKYASSNLITLGLMVLAVSSVAGSQAERTILLYFDNPALESSAQAHGDSSAFPVQEFAVARTVRGTHPERQSILELLRGPTEAEADSGYTTNLGGLRLSRFVLSRGKATVCLKGKLMLKGALSGLRLRKQVERTVGQFRTVCTVVLFINGRKDFDSLK
jgi:hypothetical protein